VVDNVLSLQELHGDFRLWLGVELANGMGTRVRQIKDMREPEDASLVKNPKPTR